MKKVKIEKIDNNKQSIDFDPSKPLYLKPKTVAEELNISVDKVYNLINTGRLEFYNFGEGEKKSYRISRSQLDKFIDDSLGNHEQVSHSQFHIKTKKKSSNSIAKIISKESLLKKLEE
ncbi:Helix-turn-helix domain containing protein [Candidatus Hepatincola sp. Av]